MALITSAQASGVSPLCPNYGGHADLEGKFGKRDIGEASIFLPVACTEQHLLFSDLRYKLDNQDSHEFNAGLGARVLKETGILGGYAYFDRRRSGETDKLHSQVTLGAEWLAENWEVRGNAYIPLTGEKTISEGIGGTSAPFLSGSGIFVRETSGVTIKEESLYGGDVEAGFKIPDTKFWLHAGAFSFNGEDSPSVEGVRGRIKYDITENIAVFAEGQYDDERGRQGWLGVRLSVPFGGPEQKPEGLKARMTASPVRDVDIVTQTKVEKSGNDRVTPVLNAESGTAQRVLYVDNAATMSTNAGTAENPYITLAAAQAALQDNDILYIRKGSGTAGMDNGITINRNSVTMIGAGSDLLWDNNKFITSSGLSPTSRLLIARTSAPTITNTILNGDGVSVTGNNITLTGFTVDGADRDGIAIHANNAAFGNIMIDNVTATNNRIGIYLHALNNGSMTAAVQNSIASSNAQHGIAVYDDTSGTFEVDLGGGGRSAGNNVLAGNDMEDLAIDYDGRTLSAQNNWWGQASGLYQFAPSGGLRPQIYYGAPINDGLVGHWTFDTEWMSGTTAYDRSGYGHNGTMGNGLSLANVVNSQHRQSLSFDGVDDGVTIAANPVLDGLADNYSVISVSRINTAATSGMHTIYTSGSSDQNYWQFYLSPNAANAQQTIRNDNNTGGGNDTAIFSKGQWTQSSVVRNGATGTNLQFYLDGTATSARSLGAVNSNGTKAIGRRTEGNSHNFYGEIDDVRVYNRSLTASEIAELDRMDTSSVVDSSSYRTSSP